MGKDIKRTDGKMDGKVAIYREDPATGDEVEVLMWYRLTYFFPGEPGRYSGPPEDCYPEEPAELEWDLFSDEAGTTLVYDEDLSADELKSIEEQIWDAEGEALYEPAEPPDRDDDWDDDWGEVEWESRD